MTVNKFSDGEISCCINESVRDKDVYLFQSFGEAVNDNIMELLLTVAALRRAGAGTITAVIPYYGYKFHRNRGMPISTTFQSRFLWNAAGDIAKVSGYLRSPYCPLVDVPSFLVIILTTDTTSSFLFYLHFSHPP